MVDRFGSPNGRPNPLSYQETAVVTAASVALHSSEIDHTESATWPNVNANVEGTIIGVNSNVTMFYYDRADNTTKAIPYEYLRTGTSTMADGASKASSSIRVGDTVGIMSSYIYRSGSYAAVQGTPKLRTNVQFVVVA